MDVYLPYKETVPARPGPIWYVLITLFIGCIPCAVLSIPVTIFIACNLSFLIPSPFCPSVAAFSDGLFQGNPEFSVRAAPAIGSSIQPVPSCSPAPPLHKYRLSAGPESSCVSRHVPHPWGFGAQLGHPALFCGLVNTDRTSSFCPLVT